LGSDPLLRRSILLRYNGIVDVDIELPQSPYTAELSDWNPVPPTDGCTWELQTPLKQGSNKDSNPESVKGKVIGICKWAGP
jgi:hypothetical protein